MLSWQRALGVTMAVLAGGILAPAALPDMPSGGEVIAYQGNGHIYLTNVDSGAPQPLVGGVADRSFAWSPDGGSIAFTAGAAPMRNADDPSAIKIVTVDGTTRLLTRGPGRTAREPSWSPDGKRLVFTAFSEADGRWELYLIRADGKGLHKLTRGGGSYGNDDADWSPDGRWIVLESWSGGVMHTMQMIHPDGSGLRRIRAFPASNHCLCPDWSPDGAQIAYQADADVLRADSNQPEVFVMNADGTGSQRLTHNTRVLDENPDWSPDGTRIAFYSTRNGNAEVYVTDADGANARRITHDSWYSQLPRWQPHA